MSTDTIQLAIKVNRCIGGHIAIAYTNCEIQRDGRKVYYNEDGFNFCANGRRGVDRKTAIANLKEFLEGYECEFEFIPLKDLPTWDLRDATPWTSTERENYYDKETPRHD